MISKTVARFLDQPYPAPKLNAENVLMSILFGLFIAFFLLFFLPFDLNLLMYENKSLTISFFGWITTATMLLFLVIIPQIVPRAFDENHWRMKHQLVYFQLLLLAIATGNGLYINHINDLSFSWSNYGIIIVRTYAIGIIPLTIALQISLNRRLNYFLKEAKSLESAMVTSTAYISQELELENKVIVVNDSTFLYVEADGNYLYLFQQKTSVVTKDLYRASLNQIVDQTHQLFIQRCHRSYIVNLNKIEKIEGNAQGLRLTLTGVENPIPVSRKYIASIREKYASFNTAT